MTSFHQPGNRVASAAIRGYVYQFDRTIIEILQASRDSVVTVEGCEDIDIDNGILPESIQCKYLASAKYSLAGLRDVILPMLQSFNDGRRWQYRLYAHYADGRQAPTALTLQDLKISLTETKRKSAETIEHYKDFSEEVLRDFVRHFTITSGNSIESQKQEVLAALSEKMFATLEDSKDLHYGNAIAYVMDLAMRPTEDERKIKKGEFIEQVNKRKMLFTRWQEEVLGRTRIAKMMRSRLKTSRSLRPTNRRTLVVNGRDAAQNGRVREIAHLIEILATEHYGPGRLHSAKPWTVVVEGADSDVGALKVSLINEGIVFNDGYESIAFSPEIFDTPPVINVNGSKIRSASHSIRIVGSDTYIKYMHELKSPHVIVSFSHASPACYSSDKVPYEFHLRSTNTEEMIHILRAST
ncbi:hypothetical protein GCM10022252_20660 [Streptosporangium oxazolinicum]|uniref:DUF4297 domain-containing protein n=1 Tax=Streptosporangium oxazolinicum TaxID=909287 RepID=A0ABP8APD6_9ACTN